MTLAVMTLETTTVDKQRLMAMANPKLIVGRLSGYGPDADPANDPAFDYTAFWALSGLMDHLRDLDSPPGYMRPGMGDHSAGMSLVVGILAALRDMMPRG